MSVNYTPSPEEKKWGCDLVRYGVNKAARERNIFEKDSIPVGGGLLCHGGSSAIQGGSTITGSNIIYGNPPPPCKQNQTRPKRAIVDLPCKCKAFTYRWFSFLMFNVFAAFC